jgi:predicted DNA-binding protein
MVFMPVNRLEARLEIRLLPETLQMLKDEAARKNTSVGGIVREAIDSYCAVPADEKLAAVRKLAELKAPVAAWDKMKKEI